MTDTVNLSVRQNVRSLLNTLTHFEDRDDILNVLHTFKTYLTPVTQETLTNEPPISKSACQEFTNNHYTRLLNALVSKISVDWLARLDRAERKASFDWFFLNGPPADSLLVLCSNITQLSPSFRLMKCVDLLEEFLRGDSLKNLLTDTCIPSSGVHSLGHHRDNQLLQILTNIPELMGNKLQRDNRDYFLPKSFYLRLGEVLSISLHHVYTCLKGGCDCSMEFLSNLTRRCCSLGYADEFMPSFLGELTHLCHSDFLWKRISQRLVLGSNEISIDSLIIYLIKSLKWYGMIVYFLGDSIQTNDRIRYIFSQKMIFQSFYDNSDVIIHNVIGYIAGTGPSVDPHAPSLLMKVFMDLLRVWGDKSAILHTAYEQHRYITKCLLCCLGHLHESEINHHKLELHRGIAGAMDAHLSSPMKQLRRLGMVAAEAVTMAIDRNTAEPLKFEYDVDGEVESLLAMTTPPAEESPMTPPYHESCPTKPTSTQVHCEDISLGVSETDHGQSYQNLDSDDDLEPYDMTDDTTISKTKPPVYIRDCIEGLIVTDNHELTELSLNSCEKIIKSRPAELIEVGVELLKVLLHLNDQYNTDNFSALRHTSMVAITVLNPIPATEYLTQEFYERNYNIKQRLDMLQVLASSAHELSQPNSQKLASQSVQSEESQLSGTDDVTDWREIVQKRIDSKTRRFGKGPPKSTPVPALNRFSPVAGHFFFPLIRYYDRKLNTVDLLGSDHLLLGRLLYTLGIIQYAAMHAPVLPQIARTLIEFIWAIRYHSEIFVRQGLLFSLSMLFLSAPTHLFVAELQHEMVEIQQWLQDILDKDTCVDCRKLALQNMMIMKNILKKELGDIPTDVLY